MPKMIMQTFNPLWDGEHLLQNGDTSANGNSLQLLQRKGGDLYDLSRTVTG